MKKITTNFNCKLGVQYSKLILLSRKRVALERIRRVNGFKFAEKQIVLIFMVRLGFVANH